LLGSVSNSRGIDSSIQKTPSSFVSSYSTVSYSRPTEISTSVKGSRYSFGKDGSGGSSCIIDRSRILFSSLHCSEEDRGNVTSPQHLLGCSPLQNGDQSFYQSFDSSRFVDHFPGSFRLLFPYSYLPFIPQIPSVCLGQQSLPIQSSSIRPVDCTTSFYQSYAGSHSSSSFPSYSDSFLHGRLSDQGTISRETLSQH
jgi:hypothetical protein